MDELERVLGKLAIKPGDIILVKKGSDLNYESLSRIGQKLGLKNWILPVEDVNDIKAVDEAEFVKMMNSRRQIA